MKRRLIFIPILLFMLLTYYALLSKSPLDVITGWASDAGLMYVKAARNSFEGNGLTFAGHELAHTSLPMKWLTILSAKLNPDIPMHLRGLELFSVVLVSFGLLFLLLGSATNESRAGPYLIIAIFTVLNPVVLGSLLDLDGGPVAFLLLSLILYLFSHEKPNLPVIAALSGVLCWCGWQYCFAVVGLLFFLISKRQGWRKRLWATVQVLSAFGLALVPLVAIGQFPGSLNLYTGNLYTFPGMGIGDENFRNAALFARFFPGGERFWTFGLSIAELLLVLSLGYAIRKNRKLMPYVISFAASAFGMIFFGLELWTLFLLVGFAFALYLGRKESPRTVIIVIAVLAASMAIPWLRTPDRSIDPYLEMARYISRAISEDSEIVTFRPGILSTVTGRELEYPERIPYAPKDALLKAAPDAEWAVICLSSSDAADVPSTYETKPFTVFPYGDCVLGLMPMSVLPNKILVALNISHY